VFEVVDQVVVSKDGDVLGLYLWRGSTAVLVVYNTIESGETNAVHGMTGLVVWVDLDEAAEIELELKPGVC
jgi:hypothetical protein